MLVETEDQSAKRYTIRKRRAITFSDEPFLYLREDLIGWTTDLQKTAFVGTYRACVQAVNETGPHEDGVKIVGIREVS